MDNKQIPNKLFFKIGEVCEITDTQPYVLRYWESEFPALAPAKNSSGQRIYRRKDIETVLRIKQLLYEEGFTIAGREEAARGRDGRARPDALRDGEPARDRRRPTSSRGARAADADPPTTRARCCVEVREQLRGMLTLLDKGDRKSS